MNKSRCHYGCWLLMACQGKDRAEMIDWLIDKYNLNEDGLLNKTNSELQLIADDISEGQLGHIKDNFKLGYNN